MKTNDIKLTIKQRAWLQHYCNTSGSTFGNATQSAILAYDLDETTQYDSARVIGSENLTKLNIQITDLMNKMGLTDAQLVIKLSQLLNSQKPYGKDGKLFSDNQSQLKALELSLKLKKLLNNKPIDEGGFFSTEKLEVVIV